jgi:hypothetical protein
MQKFLFGLCVAIVALSFASSVSAQDKSKSGGPAKGVVTSVAADAVTINVAGAKALTFAIDAKTAIIGHGAGTATKEAKKEGAKGAKVGDLVKAGDEVEVKYADAGGKMVASEIRVTKAATKK